MPCGRSAAVALIASPHHWSSCLSRSAPSRVDRCSACSHSMARLPSADWAIGSTAFRLPSSFSRRVVAPSATTIFFNYAFPPFPSVRRDRVLPITAGHARPDWAAVRFDGDHFTPTAHGFHESNRQLLPAKRSVRRGFASCCRFRIAYLVVSGSRSGMDVPRFQAIVGAVRRPFLARAGAPLETRSALSTTERVPDRSCLMSALELTAILMFLRRGATALKPASRPSRSCSLSFGVILGASHFASGVLMHGAVCMAVCGNRLKLACLAGSLGFAVAIASSYIHYCGAATTIVVDALYRLPRRNLCGVRDASCARVRADRFAPRRRMRATSVGIRVPVIRRTRCPATRVCG